MQRLLIDQHTIDSTDPAAQPLLQHAYERHVRPLCMCMSQGLEMYIARVEQRCIVKRMPNSGSSHHPDCEAYEAPATLSGLGQLVDAAIREDAATGLTDLRLDFPLTRQGPREPPVPNSEAPSAVRSEPSRLTLRALLHYLWEQAELNRWSPGMEGKRNWFVVRAQLLKAALGKTARRDALADRLFIPETFSVERKTEIEQRRLAKLSRLAATSPGRELMLLIGEVKAIEPARYAHRLVVRHLPDLPLLLSPDVHRQLHKRFADLLELWSAHPASHLVVMCTIAARATGVVSVDQMSLMLTTGQWLPIEHHRELQLVERLTQERRRFSKCLRYGMPTDHPLAAAVLTDTGLQPTALFVTPLQHDAPRSRARLEQLLGACGMPTWTCDTKAVPVAPLPARIAATALGP